MRMPPAATNGTMCPTPVISHRRTWVATGSRPTGSGPTGSGPTGSRPTGSGPTGSRPTGSDRPAPTRRSGHGADGSTDVDTPGSGLLGPGGVAAPVAAATACSSRPGASVMARRTPTLTVGLPAKRSRPRTSTSAARMTASAAAIVSAASGTHPAAPCASTAISCPAARALCSRDSAAM